MLALHLLLCLAGAYRRLPNLDVGVHLAGGAAFAFAVARSLDLLAEALRRRR